MTAAAPSPARELRRARLRSHVSRRSPRGEVVSGLLKLVVGLVVVAVPVIDASAVVIAKVNGEDRANEIARLAAETYQGSRNIDQAYDAAVTQADLYDSTVIPQEFYVEPDGQTIRLEVEHQAKTILLGRIEPLREYAVIVSEGRGRPFA